MNLEGPISSSMGATLSITELRHAPVLIIETISQVDYEYL